MIGKDETPHLRSLSGLLAGRIYIGDQTSSDVTKEEEVEGQGKGQPSSFFKHVVHMVTVAMRTDPNRATEVVKVFPTHFTLER